MRFHKSRATHPGLDGTHLLILAFLLRDWTRRSDGEDLCRWINPFGMWLPSLCNGFGGEEAMEQEKCFFLAFYLFYQSRLAQLSFDSITGLNVLRMVGGR